MRFTDKQQGFAHAFLIIGLVVALVGALGFVFWQNFIYREGETANVAETTQQKPSVPKTNIYADWLNYKSSKGAYSLKYPAGWTYREAEREEITRALAAVTFMPPELPHEIITVSSYKSDLSPNDFVDSENISQVIDFNNDPIDGNSTYYHKYGDGTYINRSYVISHSGIITTISMTETSSDPSTDNSKYVSEFDMLAKSIKL